jgi:hypothetical protein
MTWILDENDQPIPENNPGKWARWRAENNHKVSIGYKESGKFKVIFDFVGAGPRSKLWTVQVLEEVDLICIQGFPSRDEALDFYNQAVAMIHHGEVNHSMLNN